MEQTITTRSTSASSAIANSITLRQTETTRLIFNPIIVKNQKDPEASVKGAFIYQRKIKSEKWEDCNKLPLSKLKAGEWIKLELKSSEIKKLLDYLPQLKDLFKKYGITWGQSSFVITNNNIYSVMIELSKLKNKEIIIKELGKLQSDDFINISQNLLLGLQIRKRKLSVEQFEKQLIQNLTEHEWQNWFKDNQWILGSEFIKILDNRSIDTKNIADYLVKAYDGFLDIVEIKRPEKKLTFWSNTKDHNNLIPSTDLVKAITQVTKYIYEIEREANSTKFQEKTQSVKVIKPRGFLIFGRSCDWGKEQYEAYRILNSNYHNLTILTYDQILDRAKRMLNIDNPK